VSKSLSELQLRFVDAYCGEARGNAAEAVRIAGYRCKTPASCAAAGSRLLASVNIQQVIKERTEQAASARIATIEEVQQVLTEIMRNPGEESQHRINSAKELAKMQGAYAAAKVELTGKDGGPVESKSALDVSKLPTEVLKALVAARRERDA